MRSSLKKQTGKQTNQPCGSSTATNCRYSVCGLDLGSAPEVPRLLAQGVALAWKQRLLFPFLISAFQLQTAAVLHLALAPPPPPRAFQVILAVPFPRQLIKCTRVGRMRVCPVVFRHCLDCFQGLLFLFLLPCIIAYWMVSSVQAVQNYKNHPVAAELVQTDSVLAEALAYTDRCDRAS